MFLPPPEPWMRDAKCLTADPDLWHPEKSESAAPAKRICATCPVIEACLEYALANDERRGVWGGLSARERRDLRRQRRATPTLRRAS